MYWLWKNAPEKKDDIIGLVHYRRGFTTRKQNLTYSFGGRVPENLSMDEIERLLSEYQVIVPIPETGFKTSYQTYAKMHYQEDMDMVKESIGEICPEYIDAFNKAMNCHYYYNGNMLIARKIIFDAYVSWLFSVFDRLEKKINIAKYEDAYQSRVYGFISERLLNVWLLHNDIKFVERPVFNTEIRSLNVITKNVGRIRKLIKM
jgi:hypothetical protein